MMHDDDDDDDMMDIEIQKQDLEIQNCMTSELQIKHHHEFRNLTSYHLPHDIRNYMMTPDFEIQNCMLDRVIRSYTDSSSKDSFFQHSTDWDPDIRNCMTDVEMRNCMIDLVIRNYTMVRRLNCCFFEHQIKYHLQFRN